MSPPELTPAKPNGQVPPQAVPQAIPVVSAVASDAEEREILVSEIDPEDNARKYFDPEQLQALADNIAANGLLNAPIVYRHLESGRYRLIAGERRWRAVRLLVWKSIRARVLKDRPDEARRKELALIDNEQREDLSDIERGIAYDDFMTRTGCTASALAKKLGKSVSSITRPVALVKKLPADLIELIRTGKLPPAAARELTGLKDDQAKRHFARLYTEGKIKSGDELAAAIKAAKNGRPASSDAGFTAEEGGIRIAITWNSGPADAQALDAVENALRVVLKDLAGQKKHGLDHWKTFLEKKKAHAKIAEQLASAQNALARHAGGNGNGAT